MSRSLGRGFLGGVVVVGLFAGCAAKKPTAIVVAISSEGSVPDELDELDVVITRDGDNKFSETYVLPVDTPLPGTLTVQNDADHAATDAMIVTILAKRTTSAAGPTTRVVRRARLGFSEEKTKLLRMPLRYSCYDLAAECVAPQSCIGGLCREPDVDVEKLVDFVDVGQVIQIVSPDQRHASACFLDKECFASVTEVDASACSFTTSIDPSMLNVGVRWKSSADGDLVVLDRDPIEGYTVNGNQVKLADGVCEAMKRGRALSIAISSLCPAKTPETPGCATPESAHHNSGGAGGVGGNGGSGGAPAVGGASPVGGAAGMGVGGAGAGGKPGTGGNAGMSGTSGQGGSGGGLAGQGGSPGGQSGQSGQSGQGGSQGGQAGQSGQGGSQGGQAGAGGQSGQAGVGGQGGEGGQAGQGGQGGQAAQGGQGQAGQGGQSFGGGPVGPGGGGQGGISGNSGAAGMTGATGGAASLVQEVCNGFDDDGDAQIDNGDPCTFMFPEALNFMQWKCQLGLCMPNCAAGFFNPDGHAFNGCEQGATSPEQSFAFNAVQAVFASSDTRNSAWVFAQPNAVGGPFVVEMDSKRFSGGLGLTQSPQGAAIAAVDSFGVLTLSLGIDLVAVDAPSDTLSLANDPATPAVQAGTYPIAAPSATPQVAYVASNPPNVVFTASIDPAGAQPQAVSSDTSAASPGFYSADNGPDQALSFVRPNGDLMLFGASSGGPWNLATPLAGATNLPTDIPTQMIGTGGSTVPYVAYVDAGHSICFGAPMSPPFDGPWLSAGCHPTANTSQAFGAMYNPSMVQQQLTLAWVADDGSTWVSWGTPGMSWSAPLMLAAAESTAIVPLVMLPCDISANGPLADVYYVQSGILAHVTLTTATTLLPMPDVFPTVQQPKRLFGTVFQHGG